jgi:uncharacterized protein (TIGR04255 family)
MEMQLPVSLGYSPLVESIFEIRFEPAIPAAGDLLPGLLFSKLNRSFPNVESLPISNVPRPIRDQDPALVFQPSHRLTGSDMIVQVGDRVISLSAQEYPGWSAFKSEILNLINVAFETGFIGSIIRYSFRYINLIPRVEGTQEMSLLDVNLLVSGTPPQERGLQMRLEQDEGEFTTIIQIALQSVIQHPNKPPVAGVMVDVDTQMLNPSPNFQVAASELLDSCHTAVKSAFFSIISNQALQTMQPSYQ